MTAPFIKQLPALVENRTVPRLDLAELTRKLMKGDEAAYRVFYHAYFDRLSRYLLVVTRGDEDQMREALQGTFLRVVRNIRLFSDEPIFWSWLTVLARSASSDHQRKRSRYRDLLARFFREPQREEALATPVTDDLRDLNQVLASALELLESDERRLVEAKYFEKRSVREIALERGISEKAAESKLTRVRAKLRAAIIRGLDRESSRP